MTAPHIIWTLQRTGGTTFASLLADLSDWPKVEHEPFNQGRIFGWIAEKAAVEQSSDALDKDLIWALWKRPVIKHCYELCSEQFNAALMDVAERRGYRHIVLDRQDETARILSLELAEVTGAWGPMGAQDVYPEILAGKRVLPELQVGRVLSRKSKAYRARAWLHRAFGARGITPFVVSFEDLFSGKETGLEHIRAAAEYLDLDLPEDFTARADHALGTKSQNSAQLFDQIPNIDALRAALDAPIAAKAG